MVVVARGGCGMCAYLSWPLGVTRTPLLSANTAALLFFLFLHFLWDRDVYGNIYVPTRSYSCYLSRVRSL